jgi:hypothetical protein
MNIGLLMVGRQQITFEAPLHQITIQVSFPTHPVSDLQSGSKPPRHFQENQYFVEITPQCITQLFLPTMHHQNISSAQLPTLTDENCYQRTGLLSSKIPATNSRSHMKLTPPSNHKFGAHTQLNSTHPVSDLQRSKEGAKTTPHFTSSFQENHCNLL